MKRIIYLFLITTSLLTTLSCEKWLNVEPKAEIKSDVMFETEQGFKDAIIGCYILMSDKALYGAELTCTFMEVLGQQYDFLTTAGNSYLDASRYQYASYRGKIDGIWNKSYNLIANLNNIIDNIDKKKDVLHPTNYGLIKAEAYGLRAYIYLDLMRIFSYGDLKNRPDVLSKPAIPYARTYDKAVVKQHTVKEVMEFLHADIEESIQLFDRYDPKGSKKADDYVFPMEDGFNTDNVDKRAFRFNIKAAYATRMRINLWEGNEQAAYDDAEKLINPNGNLGTGWIPDHRMITDEKNRDLTFFSEQLFGLETFKRYDDVIKLYFSEKLNENPNKNQQCLCLSALKAETTFEISTNVGTTDYRFIRLFTKKEEVYLFLKFWEVEKMIYVNNMPLIKKAETFYVAAEALLNTGGEIEKRKAIGYINQVRNARAIPAAINLSLDMSIEDAKKELLKEWKKEFIGDGQMFYYYKRLGFGFIPGSNIPTNDNVYILPLPETEINLGDRFDPNKKVK